MKQKEFVRPSARPSTPNYHSIDRSIGIPRTELSLHWQGATDHGPETEPANWPRWKAFHLSVVIPAHPKFCRRLWIYTRLKRFGAFHVDLMVWAANRNLSIAKSLVAALREQIDDLVEGGTERRGTNSAEAKWHRVRQTARRLEEELGRCE